MIYKVLRQPMLLSVLSAIFLSLAWYLHPVFSMIGFVPIFFSLQYFNNEAVKFGKIKFLLYCYATFLLWNFMITWWIINSTLVGALLAFFINSLLMCIPFICHLFTFKFTKKWISSPASLLITFVPFWISFEYLHYNWDLTWTWLHLGNCFANAHYFVQWYEYTGVLGGSLWILVVNVLLFNIANQLPLGKPRAKMIFGAAGIVVIPIMISLLMYQTYTEEGNEVEVTVVQPNIDPFTEKFSGSEKFIPYDLQLQRLIDLSKSKLTQTTQFLAWPETSIPAGFDEDLIEDQKYIKMIRQFLASYPRLTLISGCDTYKIYLSDFDKSSTARFGEGVGWYDYFNTAVKIENDRRIKTYHKSKLVPGVEQMPYPQLFKWIEYFAIDLGGITGSLGTQEERSIFVNKGGIGAAPVICYESIFGEYVTQYIKNGANFIAIITNDGWWGNTPGHVQHLSYARLRAIETRRSIARAANTGISGFINQKGDILISNTYWIQDAINMKIKTNEVQTFYVRYGDYIGSGFRWMSLFLITFTFVVIIVDKIKKQK